MKDDDKTRRQLIAELKQLRRRVAELEPARPAAGEVQARRGSGEGMGQSDGPAGRSGAEQERHRLRTILTAAIECLPFEFFAIGTDGRYIIQNATTRAHYGDAIGQRPEDIAPDEAARQLWRENNRRAFAGERVEGEVETHLGGQTLRFYNIIAPIREGDRFYGILGVNVDITERTRAEEALRRARDTLEQKVRERTAELAVFYKFAESAGRGYGMADLEGRITYLNPALCRLFGEERPEDVLGKHVSAYYPDEHKQKWDGEIVPALLRQGSWEGERIVLSRHGTRIPTLQHNYVIRDESGRPFRFAVAITDVSEQKRAEAALRASEERFQLVVAGAGVGIWDWDLRTGKVYYSPRWKSIFGYEEEDIGEGFVDWARLLHPEERERIIKLQEDFLAGTSTTITAEYRLRHKDGSYRWIAARGIVVRDEDGKACRLVGSHGDITDRKRAEEALEQERQSLRRMLQASDHERRLISYEIHDGLAQYLAAAGMQFQSYNALREKSPDEAARAYQTGVELVRQAHFEARRLVSEVRPPVIDETGLETAISHLVHEQRRRGGPTIELHSSVQFERLASILENALYRIVQEALSNACKYSHSKKVAVSLTQEGQEVCLKVQDWGTGFHPESVGKGHFGLEGIRERVRLLGGRLTIHSAPGAGTLLQVVMPILEERIEG